MSGSSLKILVILGNGFDINLGLKSTFSDFFNYLLSKYDSLKNYTKDGLINEEDFKEISCWPYIFLNNSNSTNYNWKDIEHNLYDFLTNENKKKFFNDHYFYDVSPLNLNIFHHISNSIFLENRKKDIIGKATTRKLVHQILYYSGLIDQKNTYDTIPLSIIENMLLSQLKVFEKLFADYMIYITGETRYLLKSQMLLRKIIQIDNTIVLKDLNNVDILNFNYTSILGVQQKIWSNIPSLSLKFSERNIHGKLPRNDEECQIIFGIDSKGIKTDNFNYSYTKTYRVINNNIRDSIKNMPTKIKNDYDYIYFYGHSLGEQDYSYFQSIFDTVNLYNGKTVLRFLYTPYHETDEENLKLQLHTNREVSKLIETYGESFEQEKIKGKNLVHRLILENRLEIIKFNPEIKKLKKKTNNNSKS